MPFCQGLLNEVLAGLMPMDLIVRITSALNFESRSKMR